MHYLMRISNKVVDDYFKENDLVIISTGANESHGPHNPLGTDTLIPSKILELIEERVDVLATPILPFGSSDAHMGFSGTISLSDDLHYQVLNRIVETMYKLGARKFVFLNGHGGNTPNIKRICIDLNQKGAQGAVFDWWRLVGDLNPKWAGGHGGAVETSANLYIDEKLVDRNEMVAVEFEDLSENLKATNVNTVVFKGISIDTPRLTSNGCNVGWFGPDDPGQATKEWGEEMLNAIADYLVEFIYEFNQIKL